MLSCLSGSVVINAGERSALADRRARGARSTSFQSLKEEDAKLTDFGIRVALSNLKGEVRTQSNSLR